MEIIEKKRGRPKLIPAVVLDADDTIFNFLGGILKVYNKRQNTCLMERDIECWGFENLKMKDARGNLVDGRDLHNTFLDYQDCGLYVGLELLDSAEDALKWMKKLGYKIIILTARNEKYGKDTELNLIFNNIAQYIDEIYFQKDKVSKIQELSKTHKIALFVDDRASTVKEVTEHCKVQNVVLIEKSHNKNEELTEGVTKVKTLFECVRFLKDYSVEAI